MSNIENWSLSKDFSWTVNEEKIANKNDENSFIPSKYIDILNDGLKNYDESFVNDFNLKKITGPTFKGGAFLLAYFIFNCFNLGVSFLFMVLTKSYKVSK